MHEYYKQYSIENAREEINKRYPKLLEDDIAFNEVIGFADAKLYQKVKGILKKAPIVSYISTEDVLQDAAIVLWKLRQKNFNEKELNLDFYAYVTRVYTNIAEAAVRKIYSGTKQKKEISIEQHADRAKDNEKIRNDYDLIGSANEITYEFNPDMLIEKISHEIEQKRLGEIIFEALSKTESVPHTVMAYCYSVLMPRMLIAFLDKDEKMSDDIQNILDKIFVEYCANEKDSVFIENKRYYGELFMKQFDLLLENQKYSFSIKPFCLSAIISPLIKNNIASAAKDEQQKKKYYRRILEEINKVCRHGSREERTGIKEIKIDRDSEVLVEAAKILMGEDSVGKLSQDFQSVTNDVRMHNTDFEWGESYKNNLSIGYTDTRNNICIDKESELIFTKFFSKPAEESKTKEGMDYLGHNIRNFSVRFKPKLMKDALNIASQCMIISNSEEAMERLRNACKKKTKSKKANKEEGMEI